MAQSSTACSLTRNVAPASGDEIAKDADGSLNQNGARADSHSSFVKRNLVTNSVFLSPLWRARRPLALSTRLSTL